MFLLNFLGVVLILLGIYLFIAEKRNKSLEEDEEGLPTFGFTKKWTFMVSGILIFFLNGLFFYANAGTAYAVQYISGGDKMIKTQGVKLKWYGRVIPLSYEISIKDIILKPDEEGNKPELPESKDGIYNREAHQWEFSDAIKADIAIAVVVGVDTEDEEVFLNMADRNRSESKLIYGRVLPNIDAALKNTCKLMDAQEYISGRASDFDRYFRDQLENGMYLVEEYYEEEQAPEVIGDTATVRVLNPNTKSAKQLKFRIKRNSQGEPIRDNKSNTLIQYGVKIYQAQVTGIDWEKSFDDRLQLQKEQVAQTQLEKQEAEKEFYRAKKEIAKGESEKAAERARLEKEQIKLTIAAETEAKVAEQNLIAEKKKFEVAQFTAKTKKELADAQAYENQRLVSAGLTPQERAEWEYKTAIGVAQQLKELKLPSTVIQGGQSSNGSTGLLETLIGANLAAEMVNKNEK
ncbi:hypothetical protein KC678_05145 [Candidatus Dojkabacteria bacterium]|uniref:Band 7 domain-containing protein n=1 Tax=Candidatus Dojkabacteria bacterium TaxID=2099670 RepID=A0A955RGT4_9BACT|nr:hypothetical protein [Candidatus Dojkabacteria bacterium]